jgi:predicted metal-dependent hydrolase
MQLRQVKDIEYQLLPGSDRQTTDIVIERSGVITVRPPKKMSPEQVDQTVLSKRMWIYRNHAEWRDLNATQGNPGMDQRRVLSVSGEQLPPANSR